MFKLHDEEVFEYRIALFKHKKGDYSYQYNFPITTPPEELVEYIKNIIYDEKVFYGRKFFNFHLHVNYKHPALFYGYQIWITIDAHRKKTHITTFYGSHQPDNYYDPLYNTEVVYREMLKRAHFYVKLFLTKFGKMVGFEKPYYHEFSTSERNSTYLPTQKFFDEIIDIHDTQNGKYTKSAAKKIFN